MGYRCLRRPVMVLIVMAIHHLVDEAVLAAPRSLSSITAASTADYHQLSRVPHGLQQKRDSNDTRSETLPANYWELSRSANDTEAFRRRYNLTLVSATPQDAALMPSWPQALLQYLLVAPPITCSSTSSRTITSTTVIDGVVDTSRIVSHWSRTITPLNFFQLLMSPFLFVTWCVSFGFTQHEKATGGWMSVLGWATWVELGSEYFGVLALPLLAFQWTASFALVIQRWKGGVGTAAYLIDDLNGCVPAAGDAGIAFLQQGARSRSFRIVQSVTFSVSSLFLANAAKDTDSFNVNMALPALGELIYTAIVASKGTPIVVSGNCMLVELNPRKGFLDSSISTRWKVFASFMGF